VWSDTDRRYQDARIIFTDTEKSNWAWDPAAKQYYWHRFFSHQPDLNYDNPAVTGAMLDVMRFWLNRGLDGFRCDAVPYLIEREGTNGENLPETHTILRELRQVIDREYGGDRVLLAEGQPVARGRAPLLRRRRRVPHGVPLPADAAPLHRPSARGHAADHRHLHAHAADPAACQWGSSCATTTSSRSRW
jgi:maltose alpha-D-glucosyltransferase/alpha-amylase